MATKYYAVLTNVGAAKLANATALGAQVEITQMAVGDGNGALPTPNPAQTALVHELRHAPLNTLSIDPNNANQIIAEQVIPEDVGGWWIREIGLFDKDGDMIAVANCAETYKPQLQEGSGRVQIVRMILIVSNTAAVTLKIDPSVVLATRAYVDSQIIIAKSYADDLMDTHLANANPHDQYPLIANALKEMADAGLVDEVLKNLGLGEAATRNVGTGTGQVPDMSSFTTGHSGAADWPIPKSGWSKGPDGVITQWGIFGFPVGQTGTNVVFPLPFPARVESITLTMADIQESLLSPTTMPAYGVNSTGTSRTGFTARMSGGGGFNLCYIAKGR
ncbi:MULTISPECIES: phage tail protein [unclassified Enterobacter]|uniref:phage tail protein n=1 Tax=unclassified Enterobacter TaxID=2608935 RepID=UPI0015FAA8C1|nr:MULTISPECIES: phage tail protein [unclassified Enterobacter]MBA7777162.1 phage tail protein [Enterobacter sp. RHBSTW-00318]MBA8038434.1 phage tail protein [Enterobacter sp. RHBSTW-00131]